MRACACRAGNSESVQKLHNAVCVYLLLAERFHEKIITYQQFSENPSIIDDPNLVVRIGSK